MQNAWKDPNYVCNFGPCNETLSSQKEKLTFPKTIIVVLKLSVHFNNFETN